MDNGDITVVLVKPGQIPQTTHIKNDLKAFEELADGPVSVERFFISGFRLVCNIDEGFGYDDRSLPKGTYFVARYHTEFENMSVHEAEEVKKVIKEQSKKRKKGLFSIFTR
ncbi:hypothetical protein [Pseudalkalibacillus berkeleyi]|uniref:Uncharacterized protein n=1 Tax=Pseudalkalibacillus berkeleyi TaxID=1069813 RepID=A0ABS9H4F7_9BACL|nr:hypothetical protein [Pseudalkalibacillus berkeleyi]MCF6138801.1 hypothetical protein [Pseudalkalibacillus berkeleyi]